MQAWGLALASVQAVVAVEALVLEQEVEEVVAGRASLLVCLLVCVLAWEQAWVLV